MDPLFVDSQCLLSCHDSTTYVTSVREGPWEVNALHMVPDISPTCTCLIAQATIPATSLVSDHKFIKIFRGAEVTLNKTRLDFKALLFSICMKFTVMSVVLILMIMLFHVIIQRMFRAKDHWTLGTAIGKNIGEMLGLDVILEIILSLAAVLANIANKEAVNPVRHKLVQIRGGGDLTLNKTKH